MQVTVDIPDNAISGLADPTTMPRQLLEAYALEGYRSRLLSRAQVGKLLGFDYWQTEQFLKARNACMAYSLADLDEDRRSLDRILGTL